MEITALLADHVRASDVIVTKSGVAMLVTDAYQNPDRKDHRIIIGIAAYEEDGFIPEQMWCELPPLTTVQVIAAPPSPDAS